MLWKSWWESPFFTLQCQYLHWCTLLDSGWIDLSSLLRWFNPFQWCAERVDENFHFLLCSANISTGARYWIRENLISAATPVVQSIPMMFWKSWWGFPFFTLQWQYFDWCTLLDSGWLDLSNSLRWFNPLQWCSERVDENFHFLLCSANISTGARYWIRDE